MPTARSLALFSEFHSGFFSTLRRSFGTKRVLANSVYCEYIKDREHVHMNSTRWVALAGYVRWLGGQGKACATPSSEISHGLLSSHWNEQ